VGKGWPELKTWALEWLQRIRELYRWNRLRLQKDADASTDAALRQALDAFVQQAGLELADPSPRDPCRKVLASLQEHWPGLTLFVEDPRIPMDNNLSERRLRGPALGRKNYYGSGALWSAPSPERTSECLSAACRNRALFAILLLLPHGQEGTAIDRKSMLSLESSMRLHCEFSTPVARTDLNDYIRHLSQLTCRLAILRREPEAVRHIVARSCRLKADIVEKDEREETGLRMVLNYGHTFAHAFETVSGYGAYLHGEAVAVGMVCASRLAERQELIDSDLTLRQERLLQQFGLPTVPRADSVADWLQTMRRDKKALGGRLRLILPRRLGEVALFDNIPEEEVRGILEEALER
jgi:hypothetical protein